MAANRLFPVNPRAITGPPKISLALGQKHAAVIIKSRLILAVQTKTTVGTSRLTSRDRFSFKTSTGLSADQILRHGRSCIAPQTVFQLTWCFRKTFLLTHRFGPVYAIEMNTYKEE